MKTLTYKILLGLSILFTIGAIVTLIPFTGASYPNVFGYASICTFAPAASLYCIFAAGSICFIRSTFFKDKEGTGKERFKRHSRSLAALALVLILSVSFSVWFGRIKAQYTDDTAAATLSLE